MSQYTQLKTNLTNNTLPSEYIKEALAYANYFQTDHHGVLNTNYVDIINDHYATADYLIKLFKQINLSLKFKSQDQAALYKVVLESENQPINLESITKDDVQNIRIVPVSVKDKEIIFKIIDDMVEEYLDETDSVHL